MFSGVNSYAIPAVSGKARNLKTYCYTHKPSPTQNLMKRNNVFLTLVWTSGVLAKEEFNEM